MKIKLLFLLLLSVCLAPDTHSQTRIISNEITWKGLVKEANETGSFTEFLYFDGALTDMTTGLPLFSISTPVGSAYTEIIAIFDSVHFVPCLPGENAYLNSLQFEQEEILINTLVVIDRKIPVGAISFIPLRFNSAKGYYEKIVFFTLRLDSSEGEELFPIQTRTYADHSVLSTGEWHKIKTDKTGIHKITYSDLQSYGIDPGSIIPKDIRLYGNAGGMLPEANSIYRHDDLQENAILVVGEEDGVFDEEDYILFFGMSPHVWGEVLGYFTYYVNYYDDYNYYFLTTSLGPGKRVENVQSLAVNPTQIITKYNDYQVTEDEEINLIQSGKKWYGDVFGEINERDYHFSFPNIVASEPVIIKTEVANRSFENEKMALQVNNQLNDTMILTLVSPSSTKYAQKKKKTLSYYTGSTEINLKFKYLPSTASSIAWLDYIMVNAQSQLVFGNGQLMFRQLSSVQDGAVSEFVISNSNSGLKVWDITDPTLPLGIEPESNAAQLSYTVATDSLREFIAFDGSLYYSPAFVGTVENQDLHGGGPYDLVIVTHPLFIDQALELADIHSTTDGFKVNVVVLDKIYNEFSSGKQDPSAIRDYMRMLYNSWEDQEPRYLLLLGDGSYDPKDRHENNSNFIPAFQNEESWITASSFVIDDFYGFYDENEGQDGIGQLDIGIGRIPVQTEEEAMVAVSKIQKYLTKAEPVLGPWRTKICMIADDEDGNLHLVQADSLIHYIPDVYNIQKIYLDAFPQIKTPSGYRYPDVTEAINKMVNGGALIVNYVGHGGKAGWAHERILGSNDIQDWHNTDELPVFITATCEFSRFDEPGLFTGGEMTFLNPYGGGIALFTTTRLAYAQSNFTVNQRVLATAFTQTNGEYPYLGDIIKNSKPPGQLTTRNFILLGDPALKMAYPDFEARTLTVKNKSTQMVADTLQALDLITVEGEIVHSDETRVTDFNGKVYISVFDKTTRYNTIGNDSYSYPVDFYFQDKIIWKGEATVTNGVFESSVMIPKDIAYNYGHGKISYYAVSNDADAMGYDNSIVIGGINPAPVHDTEGPEIALYLNDSSFRSGDLTHNDPVMFAFITDFSGINISSGGIGHEITAILDEDYLNEIILNDYFVQDLNSYQSGAITYPFYDLPDGVHTLTLKAWDNYNNSAEKSIEFVINQGAELTLSQVRNYPNPFTKTTIFSFDHTRPGDKLEINLEIFDLAGKRVMQYQAIVEAELFSTDFFNWDGTDSKGNKLRSGVYLYTLAVKDERGEVSVQQQKLVLMK